MLRLMKLEFRRNKIKTYIIASAVAGVMMTGFLFLIAYAPRIDHDADLQMFAGYNNLTSLFFMVNMAVFATLSGTMYARFIIEEYKEKRAILLFSYPVKRDRIMLAKLVVVFLFVVIAMMLSSLLAFGVFSVSETVDESLSLYMLLRALKVAIIMAIIAAEIGIIAVGIGFIKKSVPTTILSAVALSSFFCNIMFNMTSGVNKSDVAAIIFMLVTTLAGVIVSAILMKTVNTMEVE